MTATQLSKEPDPNPDKEKGTVKELSEKRLSEKDLVEKKEQVVGEDEDEGEEVDEKKLLRKIDLALIPWLSFLYLLSFLDRTSIGK